ncbi:hypothetical protein [Bacillus pseudomycoides]|uniref:hypothetical protein n=1 Tax=Bacillus pseudomycoides TaxID=64104 RepID=UPI001482A411|nr:hypothetical protein [Bacillus pseudomycoides]
MDKKDLVSLQVNNMPSDALNTPSKSQEQMQDSAQKLSNGIKIDSSETETATLNKDE